MYTSKCVFVFVWASDAASTSLPQAREHVCLDVSRFAAAWRVSFAIHVFGKQSQLAKQHNQAGCTVHPVPENTLSGF